MTAGVDDLLQGSRNLNGRPGVKAVGVERLGRIDLRFGAIHPCAQARLPAMPATSRVSVAPRWQALLRPNIINFLPISVDSPAPQLRTALDRLAAGMCRSHTMPALAKTASTHALSIRLPPTHSVPVRAWECVVVVLQALAEGEDRHRPVVRAVVRLTKGRDPNMWLIGPDTPRRLIGDEHPGRPPKTKPDNPDASVPPIAKPRSPDSARLSSAQIG